MTDQPSAGAPAPLSEQPAAAVIVRATAAEAAGAALRVAGLTVVERSLRQLARRPSLRIVVLGDGSVALPARLPAGVEARALPAAVAGGDPQQGAMAAVRALQAELGAAAVTGADVVRLQKHGLGEGIRVVDETTRRHAEDAVFHELLRADLGFIARHINKRISFPITRHLLCRLPVTPNQVTLGAGIIGLVGCVLLAGGTYGGMVGGLLLAQLQSVLDGCDGELARVRFQQSPIGGWLDTLVDDFLNLALVAGLAVGLARWGLGTLALVTGGAAFAMYLFYNVVSYRELSRQGVQDLTAIRWKAAAGRDLKATLAQGRGGRITQVVLTLGRRDTFVFAWLVLAIVKLLPLALLWALLTAGSSFAVAAVQVGARSDAG